MNLIYRMIGGLCLAALLPGLTLRGQTVLHSPEEAWAQAQTQLSRVKTAAYQSQDLAADAKISQAGYLPTLRLTGKTDYYPSLPVQLIPGEIFGGQPGSFQEVRFGQPWVMNTGLEFQWPVFQMEKWLDIRASQQAAGQGLINEDLEAERLKISLIQAYYEALFWQDYVPFAEGLGVQAEALYTITQEKFEQGLISRLDLNRSESLRQQIAMQITEARSRRARTLLRLKETMQMPLDAELTLSDSLSGASLLRPVSPGVELDPALRLSLLQTDLAATRLQARKWRAAPTLSLSSSYQFQWQTDNLLKSQNYAAFNYGLVSLSLQWTLYQGGTQRTLQHKAQIQLDQAREQATRTRYELEAQTAQWQSQWQEAADLRPSAAARYDLTARNLALALSRLSEGYSNLDEYFQLYQEHIQAAQASFQNRLNLHVYEQLLQL
ncbi:MAG: TolC family protein [Bacteroidetes bacterium]|nr:MAG: TolC family protein [Bacteroidota bacterium]